MATYFFPLRFIIEAQVAALFSAFDLDFSITAWNGSLVILQAPPGDVNPIVFPEDLE
jgi:hypothetical protein